MFLFKYSKHLILPSLMTFTLAWTLPSQAKEPKATTPAVQGEKAPSKAKKETKAVISTTEGDITLELYPEKAPKTVANFVGLATGKQEWEDPKTGKKVKGKPFYKDTIFHRVIPNFMIQGGDPLGNGMGSAVEKFEDEFSPTDDFKEPGILAMANSGPNTNGSQFFITVAPTPWLNGKHTIFGKVIQGQDVVNKISEVPTGPGNKPLKEVKIKGVKIIQ